MFQLGLMTYKITWEMTEETSEAQKVMAGRGILSILVLS